MKTQSRVALFVISAISIFFGAASALFAPAQSLVSKPSQKGTDMPSHASGAFEVKLIPQPPEHKAEDSTLGRMSIDKQFHGDLEATSKGQMLTARTDVKGSAGYDTSERSTGPLRR